MAGLTEHEHLGFSYNTEREKLKIPEYGRTLQQMVDYCVQIEDRQERNQAARMIIDVMGEINPHLRNVPDFQHKLWDQLFIMSDFAIDIDSPFPTPTRDTFLAPPDKLEYPKVLDKYRYYGHYIRGLIDVACEMEDEDRKEALLIAIAKHMKKSYIAWNKDSVEDYVIFGHMEELSAGRVDVEKLKIHLPDGELGTLNPQGIPMQKKRFVQNNNGQRLRMNKPQQRGKGQGNNGGNK